MAVRDAQTWAGWVMDGKGIKKKGRKWVTAAAERTNLENGKMVGDKERKTCGNRDGCKNSGRLETREEEENTK